MFSLIITGPAKRDMHTNRIWWADHHSKEQADRWYIGIQEAMHSLNSMPEQCSYATESDLRARGIRQMLYGIGRKNTHRIIFSVNGDRVVIYRVLSVRQGEMGAEDLA